MSVAAHPHVSISTHVLDTANGKPGANLHVTLQRADGISFRVIATGRTNADGRIPEFRDLKLPKGMYKVIFDTKGYFKLDGRECLYPYVEIPVELNENGHYHIPLLVSPFSFSTYRGS